MSETLVLENLNNNYQVKTWSAGLLLKQAERTSINNTKETPKIESIVKAAIQDTSTKLNTLKRTILTCFNELIMHKSTDLDNIHWFDQVVDYLFFQRIMNYECNVIKKTEQCMPLSAYYIQTKDRDLPEKRTITNSIGAKVKQSLADNLVTNLNSLMSTRLPGLRESVANSIGFQHYLTIYSNQINLYQPRLYKLELAIVMNALVLIG